ncbi:MAG: type II secretion system major pseudopilin GspG, partial [Deltaproteobacteria bacterium]
MWNEKRSDRGFTLIEILIVIVILGILVWQIAPRIMGKPEEARRLKAQMDIATLETALKLYKLDNGRYPSSEQGLQALVETPTVGVLPKKWREGGYLEKGK